MYKKAILVFFVVSLGCTLSLFARGDNQTTNTVVSNGIGIGCALAIAICWSRTESVLTSILAGIFGWLYVLYYCFIIRTKEE